MGNLEVTQVDWQAEYERLVERIYHEDNLLAQRTSNFIATHAFLVAAVAISISGTGHAGVESFLVSYLVACFGLLLSLFYIPLGLRTCRAIYFWRVWLHNVESKLEFKLDSSLYDFFENGLTETSVGKIGSYNRRSRPMLQVFPWKLPFIRSANLWIGVWLPILIALFWCAVLIAFSSLRLISLLFIGLILVVIVLLELSRRLRPVMPRLLVSEAKQE